jgi:hypothetical protein
MNAVIYIEQKHRLELMREFIWNCASFVGWGICEWNMMNEN